MMSKEELEKWRANYRATTEALEVMRAQELRDMTDEEALRRMKLLVAADPVWRERPDWSGLVEQQEIFHRKRKPPSTPLPPLSEGQSPPKA
jgi:hypothetical protein